MQVSLRVIEMNAKWAKIVYNATNTRSRMETPKLLEDLEKGILKVTNAAMFPMLSGEEEE
ncbi:MAG: hypothetical protein KTR24_03555 [Saprospiraceae bacterium]|nr:hypothetical protein [Saprospiraceae bacterium]